MCRRRCFVLVILFALAFAIGCNKQPLSPDIEIEFKTICGFTYGKYQAQWHHVSDSKKGDPAILTRLIVRPDSGIDMNQFDYDALGLPTLEILGQTSGGYFILDVAIVEDPFLAARTLCSTDKFDYLQFDAALQVH